MLFDNKKIDNNPKGLAHNFNRKETRCQPAFPFKNLILYKVNILENPHKP
jgi:hypothetical protein